MVTHLLTKVSTKVSNRLGNIVNGMGISGAVNKLTKSSNRLADALDAFKFTLVNGKFPKLDYDASDSADLIAGEELSEQPESGHSQDALLPDEFGHFSDGTPLNIQSYKAWQELSLEAKIHRNAQHLQASVVQWEDLVQSPLRLTSEVPNVASYFYVFMHIPKAGGTTLQHIVSKNYLPNQFVHANSPQITSNPSIVFHANRRQPRAILMGHYERSGLVYEFLSDRPIIHFTMLRDPVKRVISYFNYIKTRPGHPLHEQAKDWTLEDYARSSVDELQNKQTLRLLGDFRPETSEQSVNDPEPLLAEAKQVLEKEYTLFGLTERYAEFLIMAKNMLGWHEIVYLRKNSSKRNKASRKVIESNTITDKAVEMIRERNQLDIALYDFANELFSQRCHKMGIDQEAIDQYENLSKDYQTILAGLKAL